MAHPIRYFLNNQFIICRPIDTKNIRTIAFQIWTGDNPCPDIKSYYSEAKIDVYSAPDIVLSYEDGDTTKDEFVRCEQWNIKEMKLINQKHIGEYILYEFSYLTYSHKEFWGNNKLDDDSSYRDIPVGKYSGLTSEQIALRRSKKIKFSSKLWGKK